MTKTVTLDGFNKLAGLQLLDYIIESYDDAGLHLSISAYIQNPSTIGMTIPVSNFQTLFHGTVLGPAIATNMQLIAHSPSNFALNATISAGPNPAALKPLLEGIFHNAISNTSTPLQAKGLGAPGLSWLDAAIKTLTLDTALPPLPYSPIVSVKIDAMEMDFTCPDCLWKPSATSTITAQTKLPFRNRAPIVALSQSVQILDTEGNLVGTLDTDYANTTATGDDLVTFVTPTVPLVIPDGSQKTYEGFIGALTAADIYTLGLRGTASSKLHLGPFGDIEVKGIALDVRTGLAGLQGLKNIDFKSILLLESAYNGDENITSQVVVHNPSQLTLTIGELVLQAGVSYLPAGLIGVSIINNLKLVPGPNNIVAVLELLISKYGKVASDTATNIGNPNVTSTTLCLYGFSGSSSNAALAAGLSNLQSSTIIYSGAAVSKVPPYDPIWDMKMLPNTGVDGIFELSAVFHNPYPGIQVTIQSIDSNQNFFPNAYEDFSLGYLEGAAASFGDWFPDPTFEPVVFGPNDTSKTISWKAKVGLTDNAFFFNYPDEQWASFVQTCIEAPCRTNFVFMPVITVGQDPTPQSVDWSCLGYYPQFPNDSSLYTCATFARAPADFGVIRQYLDVLRGPAPTLAPTLAPLPTLSTSPVPVTPSPSVTVVPSPATTSVVDHPTGTASAPAPSATAAIAP